MAPLVARTFRTLRLEPGGEGLVATLILSRPDARNAIDAVMAGELREVCEALTADQGIRALVLTGAGDRAFSAGADLIERRRLTPEGRSEHTAAVDMAAEAVADLPFPTIAAVRGFALGGGAELAIACDLRVGSRDAVFGFPEVQIGVFPGAGGVRRLPSLVGLGAARRLLFTGRRIDAEESARIGLIDILVDPEEVVAAAIALAGSIAANAPLAVRAVKRALRETAAGPQDVVRARVNALRGGLDATADYEEGLAAFAEKRRPRFSGA